MLRAIVVLPDPLGADSTKSIRLLDILNLFANSLDDPAVIDAAAADYLAERGIADPAHLGIKGASYGGYAASLIVTQTNRFPSSSG